MMCNGQAESVVRSFLAANLRSDVDELIAFFSDDAVFTDSTRGVHRGIDAIRAEFEGVVKVVPSTTMIAKTLVADGGTVMIERLDVFDIAGTTFELEVAAVYEVDDSGRITRQHDYYDVQSITERAAASVAAALASLSGGKGSRVSAPQPDATDRRG